MTIFYESFIRRWFEKKLHMADDTFSDNLGDVGICMLPMRYYELFQLLKNFAPNESGGALISRRSCTFSHIRCCRWLVIVVALSLC